MEALQNVAKHSGARTLPENKAAGRALSMVGEGRPYTGACTLKSATMAR